MDSDIDEFRDQMNQMVLTSNEFQDHIQSLPCEIGMTSDPLYLYKGFWYNLISLKGSIASQGQFEAQPTDVIVVTPPKSGTTWLKSLVFAITQRTHYPISDPNHPLMKNNPHSLVPFLHRLYVTKEDLTAVSSDNSPRLFAVHVPYSMLPDSVRASKCRILYMCRNLKDVFVSMWYFGKNVLPNSETLEKAFEKFCKGIVWNGPLWDQAVEYWKMSLVKPEEVLFLKFEDLKVDTTNHLKRMAEYLGCPFSDEEERQGVIEGIEKICSFQHLSNLEVNKTVGNRCLAGAENSYFFRKGEVGDWMNLLTPSMAERLERVVEEKLQGSGLTM
ncbi:hydroxyjasmonate sulfotransferase [Ranunculus cassubicifolius]